MSSAPAHWRFSSQYILADFGAEYSAGQPILSLSLLFANVKSHSKMKNYQDLQDTLDRVVGSIGLNNTIHLLGCFTSHLESESNKPSRQQAIRTFITSRVVREFDIDSEALSTSELAEYVQARAVIYHLLFNYAQLSYRLIGEYFGQRPGYSVKYYVGKCTDQLSVPRAARDFCLKYRSVEQDLIQFISHHI